MRRLALLLAAGLVLAAAPAVAQEDCAGFNWPLATELSWLRAADPQAVDSGASLAAIPERAIALALKPQAETRFPAPSSARPRPDDASRFAGFVTFGPVAAPGTYQVTLSADSWIDVVQDGKTLESVAHTGKTTCPGLRKSVRFTLGPGPFSIQVSRVAAPEIRVTIRPAQ